MAPPFISQKGLRILQGLFLTLVVLGVGTRVLDGGSVLESVIGGAVVGGLVFLSIALLYLVYLFGKRQSAERV